MPLVVLFAAISAWGCGDNDNTSFGRVDLNKDGKVIFEEGVIAYPDLTVEEYRLYDKDGGGALSGEEYEVFVAARKSGPPPKPQAEAAPATTPSEPAGQSAPAAPAATPPVSPDAAPSQATPAAQPPATADPAASAAAPPAPLAMEKLKTIEVSSASGASPSPATPPEPEKKPSGPSEIAYTVQPGDTLNKIARKFGVSAKDIIAKNRIENPDKVEAGKVLDIPQEKDSVGAGQAPSPEILAFVEEFFARSGADGPDGLMEFYADEVEFYKKGLVAKDFVREDKTQYFQRWPKREYKPSGKAKVADVPGTKKKRIEVPVRYKAKNAEKTASGEAVFVFVVSFDSGAPRIVSEDSGPAPKK